MFGVRGHGFELDDPLSREELANLEAQLGVALPADYRSFLLEVGAGGAGPSYGLYPVRRAGGGWCWVGDGADLADLGLVGEPFPGPLDGAALTALFADRPDEEEFEDVEQFFPVFEAWEERMLEIMWPPERTAGAICLCHHGCALRSWLIVSGPERGHIWFDGRADEDDMTPELIDGALVTFERWYADWLRETEREASRAQ